MTLDNRGLFLAGRGFDCHSQFGEDGLIEAAFQRFGTANRWCFEVGAHDGMFMSNTLRLRDTGWSCVLIEADQRHEDALRVHAREGVTVQIATVGKDHPIDCLLADSGCPRDMDLGVIDIDGQDWWAWYDMRDYRPRVMLVEFNKADGMEGFIPRRGGDGQAGLKSILYLGRRKGYVPLARTHVNVIFARGDLCQK